MDSSLVRIQHRIVAGLVDNLIPQQNLHTLEPSLLLFDYFNFSL
jgi:hypothetical protein